jgi:antitoxin component of MazEF toxin-antitoxin module
MTNLLRVLDLLEKADIKALQCEIPVELLEGLNLQEDGTVDLETLLKICHRATRLESLKNQSNKLKLKEPSHYSENSDHPDSLNPDLMDLIFNPDIAANFSNLNPNKTQN